MNIYLTIGFFVLVVVIFVFIYFLTKNASPRHRETNRVNDTKGETTSIQDGPVNIKANMTEANKVIVVGLDIPFWDLVYLMVKIAFAAIPAMFIVAFIWSILINVLAHSNF